MDPISDMLIRIKNAGLAGNEITIVPYSNLKFEILNILQKMSYIKSFDVKGKKALKRIEVVIAYKKDKEPRIEEVERASKPSRRMYAGYKSLKPVRHGIGMAILSTPGGIMTDEDARKNKLGGEILFRIW